jgi:excisionase family DNA binding protein
MAPIETRPELMTVTDIAATLRCSRQTVYNLMHAGRLRTVKFGERNRVLRRDLDAYLSSLEEVR